MAKQIEQRSRPRYGTSAPTPRYEAQRERHDDRLLTRAEREPRLGPYEFRYEVEFGYTAQPRFL